MPTSNDDSTDDANVLATDDGEHELYIEATETRAYNVVRDGRLTPDDSDGLSTVGDGEFIAYDRNGVHCTCGETLRSPHAALEHFEQVTAEGADEEDADA